MEKRWWMSKTVQGILVAVFGAFWGVWFGESEISKTIFWAGLGWAGYGARDTMK